MAEKKKAAQQEIAKQEESPVITLKLKGAASFGIKGMKFIKGIPVQINDETIAERLLKSGLFEKVE